MENSKQKGKFQSNFGFLMAAIGSAVGLGNLWGFPYKMGNGGGFAFLFLYLILAVCIGYSCMLAEFAIGRKSGKGAIGAYERIGRRFMFNGWIATMAPFFLMMFYLCLGGYCIKYLIANFGDIFGASWGVGDVASGDFFNTFVADPVQAVGFTLIFAVLTIVIVMGGVANGLERFSVIAMPALFVMLLITVIRSVTLPGAAEGLAFMFKPNFEVFKGWGWLKVLASAGGQLFFSLSLASSALIAYSSYLDKKENLERNALIVPAADTTVAILCGLATLPAVFAAGLEPTQGPGMLFVTLQTVFQSMSGAGPIFGTIFYLLVFLAALTSSISLYEVGVAYLVEERKYSRRGASVLVFLVAWILGILCSLSFGPLSDIRIFGQTIFNFFDKLSANVLMPVGGLLIVIFVGWVMKRSDVLDELTNGGTLKNRGVSSFVWFLIRYVCPLAVIAVFLTAVIF